MQHRSLTQSTSGEHDGAPGQNDDLTPDLEILPRLSGQLSRIALISSEGEIELAGRRYVRQRPLAELLKVSPRTLARWNALGIGPPKITIGKTILFDLAKLPDWLATREVEPTRNARRRRP